MTKIKVGPILGVESDTLYTLCFSTEPDVKFAEWVIDGNSIKCKQVAETPSSVVWRAEHKVTAVKDAKTLTYQVLADGDAARCQNDRTEWTFYSPGKSEQPKFAYMSCNGFSSLDLMHKTQEPYLLWQKLQAEHEKTPFSMMLMGGDQLYADSIWSSVTKLKEWNGLSLDDKKKRTATVPMRDQIDRFYDTLYQERWNDPSMSLMLATVPSVMMWDDHDIFDGWGSFPKELHECDVFQSIFGFAKKYFEIFQIRSKNNTSLLDKAADHYAFAVKFRGYNILALDNRTERTLEQVMSSERQWPTVIEYLNGVKDGHLLVLSGVPVVYRDFTFTENVFDATPWEEELTDDLKDHWRSKNHQGERARLIHWLLDAANRRDVSCKTVILSGDVHIGCIGVIHDQARDCKVHQVVSSGIIHPAPSRLQWIGIMAVTNDRTEYLDEMKNIRISMLTPFASDQYIRQRNYVTLLMGTDHKLWVNWESEGKDEPNYPIQ